MKKIALLFLSMALLCGCAVNPAPKTTAPATEPMVTTVPPETTEATEPVIPDGIPVETPLGTLLLPDRWDTPITVETRLGDPMVITFLCEDIRLYDLTFSTVADDHAVGCVSMDSGASYVGMRLHPLTEERDLLLDMQESVNLLLAQLPLKPVAVTGETDGAGEEIRILTPYGTVRFPLVWEDCLLTEQPAEDTLEFYCRLLDHEPVLLFTLCFGTEDGMIPASLTAGDGTITAVGLTPAELEFDESWSPEQIDLVYAMQEDMNYLLGNLN